MAAYCWRKRYLGTSTTRMKGVGSIHVKLDLQLLLSLRRCPGDNADGFAQDCGISSAL